jgi:hypothetical protein
VASREVGVEEEILEITRDLLVRLNITKLPLRSVRWVTWLLIPHDRTIVPSDLCFFEDGDVALSKALKGVLTAQEWKPLIATSLIYEFDPGVQRRLALLRPLRFATVFLAVVSPALFVKLVFPQVSLPFLPTFGLIVLGLFVLSFLFWDFSLARRRLRLLSDRKAATVVGRESLLASLRKIDSMRLGDVEARKSEKTKGWSLGRSQWPNITQRIQNLE